MVRDKLMWIFSIHIPDASTIMQNPAHTDGAKEMANMLLQLSGTR